MNTVAKNRVTMIVVPIVLGIALGLGVPSQAHADVPPMNSGGPQLSVQCIDGSVHDAPFTCHTFTAVPAAVVAPTCHKYRWWVIRHHVKRYYYACHEYPLP